MWLKILKEYLLLVIGSSMVAISLNIFFIPLNIISGGTGSISIILYKLYEIPPWISNFILNILPVLVIMLIDRNNALKTFFVIIILGVVIKLTQPYTNFIITSSSDTNNILKTQIEDLFISIIFGSILLGYGVGIIINNGGTTGGTSALAILMHKIFKKTKLTTIMLIIEIIIISLGVFVFKDIKMSLFYFLALFITILCVEKSMIGVSLKENLYILTNKHNVGKIFFHLITLNLSANIISSSELHIEDGEERLIICFAPIVLVSKIKNEILCIDPNTKIISVPSKELN